MTTEEFSQMVGQRVRNTLSERESLLLNLGIDGVSFLDESDGSVWSVSFSPLWSAANEAANWEGRPLEEARPDRDELRSRSSQEGVES